MPTNPEMINELIAARRSIYPKMYSGEAVPKQVVEKMLENANWAPTHRFTEPWRFVVFTGQGLSKLADFQSELYKEKMGADFQEEKYNKLKAQPLTCSHVIALGMKRNPSIPEVEEVAAVAAAVQNMQLTATAYGAGCYWGTGGVTFFPEAKAFFGLKPEDLLMGFLYLGMPAKDVAPKGHRGAWQEKVKWVE